MRSTLLLVAALAACTPAASAPARPTFDIEGRSVALLERDEDDGTPEAFCSGTWVSDEHVLTAAHCVADLPLGGRLEFATRADVLDDHGRVREPFLGREALVVARDRDHDLALLRALPGARHYVARLSAAPVRVGEHVQAMGHPLGLWFSFSSGNVASLRSIDAGDGHASLWLQATAPISPGNSGGGLFNDEGELVGVCSRMLPRGQALNFWIPGEYIAPFLRKAGL
jgi:S1-C subfamily serine protease